ITMRTVGHIITSAGVASASYMRYKSKPAALATFLVGWLIDLDHLVDYVRAHGWRPNWKRFSEASHEKYSGKLYLPLHSFELLALFYIFFRGPSKQPYRVGITLSVLTHLLLDQKCNPGRKPFTYFLTHRIRKKFSAQDILGLLE
ncbi:MAG: metal-dependent hydrolase, partial [Cyanobacteria bacterium]|nr:metal-dependent hydrolase [Cyanobacteriota bacterium]